MSNKLEADSILLEFDGRKILTDIYLQCETGKITGLLGRNGAGKSCLMKIIYGDISCGESVRINGTNIKLLSPKKRKLLYLPQNSFIPQRLSLKRVLMDFELDLSAFLQCFPEFSAMQHLKIDRLSAGQQRLLEVYLVVCSGSPFALLDEPFTHLSPLQIEKVKQLIQTEKINKGMLITDHQYKHITGICDKLYLLTNGKTHLVKSQEEIESLGYARI